MATYNELFGLRNDSDLKNKISVAIIIAGDTVRQEDPTTNGHAERVVWSQLALSDPLGEANKMLWAVLAANKGATVSAIQGSTDAQIQTAVDASVDLLAGVTT